MTKLTEKHVKVIYINDQRLRRPYTIEPIGLMWTVTRQHPKLQWVLMAIDADDGILKSFIWSRVSVVNDQP